KQEGFWRIFLSGRRLRDEDGPIKSLAEAGRVCVNEGKRATERAVRAEGGPGRKVRRCVEAVISTGLAGELELELPRKKLRLRQPWRRVAERLRGEIDSLIRAGDHHCLLVRTAIAEVVQIGASHAQLPRSVKYAELIVASPVGLRVLIVIRAVHCGAGIHE